MNLTAAYPSKLRGAVKKIPGVKSFINLNVILEDRWFDLHHNVDTSSQVAAQEDLGWTTDKVNFHYLAIRPKCARRALRQLPLKARQEYTFIDFGSGKGRVLLIAAQYGFKRLGGIELRRELHDRALKNFQDRRNIPPCAMESFNLDAGKYKFPNEKLVLFFFNPFGREVMTKVLKNLDASLDVCSRDVWILLHDSTSAYLVDMNSRFELSLAKDGLRIYRTIAY
jgi:hypothetical protein